MPLTHNNKQERAVGLRKVAIGCSALGVGLLYMPALFLLNPLPGYKTETLSPPHLAYKLKL